MKNIQGTVNVLKIMEGLLLSIFVTNGLYI